MAEKSRLWDDLAGVAGGAFSVLAGVGQETEAALRSRLDELMRNFDLAHGSDLEAVKELAGNARTASEDALARLEAITARLDALERRLDRLAPKDGPGTERESPPAEPLAG